VSFQRSVASIARQFMWRLRLNRLPHPSVTSSIAASSASVRLSTTQFAFRQRKAGIRFSYTGTTFREMATTTTASANGSSLPLKNRCNDSKSPYASLLQSPTGILFADAHISGPVACLQPYSMAAMGSSDSRTRQGDQQIALRFDWLQRMPLVPCHGA